MRWSCILRGQLILFPNLVSRSFVSYLTCSLTLSILDIQGLLLSSVELLCRWKIYTQMWSSWLPTKKAHATSWAWQYHHLSCHTFKSLIKMIFLRKTQNCAVMSPFFIIKFSLSKLSQFSSSDSSYFLVSLLVKYQLEFLKRKTNPPKKHQIAVSFSHEEGSWRMKTHWTHQTKVQLSTSLISISCLSSPVVLTELSLFFAAVQPWKPNSNC